MSVRAPGAAAAVLAAQPLFGGVGATAVHRILLQRRIQPIKIMLRAPAKATLSPSESDKSTEQNQNSFYSEPCRKIWCVCTFVVA